jgi:hypothetical protein
LHDLLDCKANIDFAYQLMSRMRASRPGVSIIAAVTGDS